MLTVLLLSAPPLLGQQASFTPAEPAHGWTYSGETGPEHWSGLDPANEECSAGRTESPIDIRNAESAPLGALQFDYHPGAWKLVNNGHTVQVLVPPGSSLVAEGRRYQLVQFHFHHPSEEAIAGKHFDMVIHLVHRDDAGHLAVVAVLLADGRSNAAIQTLWNALPKQEGETQQLASALDPKMLLPKKLGYYSFEGSLTTPPCTEGVQWYVLKKPTAISVAEERQFAALYPHNARPLQALNGRTIRMSK